jgi:putative hydrolase of the HAD superfamily
VPLLLLDLDNTVADRDAAFQHWLQESLSVWAPGDDAARTFLIECDDDGLRPGKEFFHAVRERFGLLPSVDVLLEDYRRLTLDGFPPMNT